MAIKSRYDNSNPKDPKLILEINNGDLAALKDVIESYSFIDYEALMRYALVALLRTEDNRLYIKEAGEAVRLNPSDKLFKPKESEETAEAESE